MSADTRQDRPGQEPGRSCPSSHCAEGAILLGVVGPDGKIIFREKPTRIDREFVETVAAGRPAEKRFRFAGKCANSACKQWTSGRCGIIDTILDYQPKGGSDMPSLPKCAIRDTCRWFSQRGGAACAVCPEIVTDTREDVLPEELVEAVELL